MSTSSASAAGCPFDEVASRYSLTRLSQMSRYIAQSPMKL